MKLTILATNDIHSRHHPFDVGSNKSEEKLGGSARRTTYIKQQKLKNSNILVFDVGDIFLGSNYFSFFSGQVEMEMLEHQGYHAMAVGNHDFDQGGLPNLFQQAEYAPDVKLLCANVFNVKNGNPVFLPYTIFCQEGYNIAVIGLLGKTAWEVTPDSYLKDLEFRSPIEIAKTLAAEVKQKFKPILMICLSHTGVDQGDRVLAQLGIFDVIFSGHQHFYELRDWEIVQASSPYSSRTYLHPGNWGGRAIARIELEIHRMGEIRNMVAETDVIDSRYENDIETLKLLEKFDNKISPVISEVIGECRSESLTYSLHRDTLLWERPPLGIFVSDCLRVAFDTAADIGMINDGAIRNGLECGKITWGAINEIWPFEDVLWKIEVPGHIVESIVRLHVARLNDSSRGMAYHFSGLRVEYDSTEKDKLQLRALEVHGRPLTQDNLYTIAVTNYCHDNDLMKNIPWFSESAKRLNSLNNIRDAIVQHVRMVRTIS